MVSRRHPELLQAGAGVAELPESHTSLAVVQVWNPKCLESLSRNNDSFSRLFCMVGVSCVRCPINYAFFCCFEVIISQIILATLSDRRGAVCHPSIVWIISTLLLYGPLGLPKEAREAQNHIILNSHPWLPIIMRHRHMKPYNLFSFVRNILAE